MSFEVIINSQIQVFANFSAFPATGLAKTIYIAKDTNSAYYWNDTTLSFEQLGGVMPSLVWGAITGNLSDQTDLINVLNNKVDKVTGKGLSTNDYTTAEKNKLAGIQAGAEVNVNADWNAISGDAQILNKPTIPSVTGLVPYTGATGNVDLGIHALSAKNIIVNHPSGSGDAAMITKSGSGEALKVVKTSGSGNAASITGGVTLLDELHLTTELADSYISSAATWNAKQEQLVSGTNIKTLEGQSLLGPGNIDLTKSDVGLGNVDNTSDLNKPISTATQTALNAKENTITAGTTAQYFRGDKTFQTLDKASVGLANVDNTSDANKPISTATQTALNNKVGSYASNYPINGYISANGQLNVGIEQANAFSDGYLSSTDYQYFATKQDELVSGGNIKTINSTSLLGSGNVAVQPTLVSGTNIKTVNGNSLLGSGDLVVGGGGAGIHALIPPATGQLINMSISSEQTSINGYGSANNIIMIPFIPANTFTINQFSFNVTTAVAGSNATISIWSNSAMKPTNRLYLSPLIPTATTGIKNQAATFTFTAGTVYWIGFNQSSACQYRVYKASDILTFSGNAFSGAMQNGWFFSGYVPGTEPNPLPGSNASQLSFFPMLLMRVN